MTAPAEPPIRLCCGERHAGVVCPDGLVMCCVCFLRFDKSNLWTDNGTTYDVCTGCAPSVVPAEGKSA